MNNLLSKYRISIIIIIVLVIGIFSIYFGYDFLRNNQSPIVKSKEKSNLSLDLIKDEVSIEVNSELPDVIEFFKSSSYLNDFPIISYYKNGNKIDIDLSRIDDYDVKIMYQDKEYNSTLKVVDNTPPIVTLLDLSITEGTRYIGRNFIQAYYDNSGNKNYTVSFKDANSANITTPGNYDIDLMVCDSSKNCTESSTKLHIYENNSNKQYVSTETKNIITKIEPVKYGVIKKTTLDVNYAVYDDGSKQEINRTNEVTEYDYSGFSRDYLSEMKREAEELYNSQTLSRNDILNAVNSYRREASLPNLTLDPKLSVLATVRAMEMVYGNRFSHVRPYPETEYQSCFSFWKEDIFDFDFDYKSFLGENIGYKFKEDKNVIDAWRQSESHYSLMIEPKYTKTGIGKYTFDGVTYWVQLFVE